MTGSIDITIVGGGMITNDLILPAIFNLQREKVVGKINVCSLNNTPLQTLKDNVEFKEAFPGQDFTAYPDLSEVGSKNFPNLYRQVIAGMKPHQAVVVAMPDQLHYEVIMEALANNQHILCVKPLVQNYSHAENVEKKAYERGLFIGIEYHKRFDKRGLLAKKDYAAGHFGEFVMGEAKMIEPYFYRFSNFQNWFTTDKTDPFVYVGCHYVDLVYFITGLKPIEVSVCGVKGKFPNGNEGYMWANGRVRFENGALLTVTDGLGYPDDGAGSNEQCLTMFCEGNGKSGMIKHNDQFRGVTHSYLEGRGCAGSYFNFINPEFYRLVPWEGRGLKPVGYGYDSVAAIIKTIHRMESETRGMTDEEALEQRRQLIRQVDSRGIIATPANSYINELVVEAARLSISLDGEAVEITYGDKPRIQRKTHG